MDGESTWTGKIKRLWKTGAHEPLKRMELRRISLLLSSLYHLLSLFLSLTHSLTLTYKHSFSFSLYLSIPIPVSGDGPSLTGSVGSGKLAQIPQAGIYPTSLPISFRGLGEIIAVHITERQEEPLCPLPYSLLAWTTLLFSSLLFSSAVSLYF